MKRTKTIFFVLAMGLLLLTGCGKTTRTNPEESRPAADTPGKIETGFVVTGPDSYDSADRTVVTAIDQKNKTLTFLNLDIGRKYTLTADGTTRFSDKYGEGIALSQISVGDVVDVTFLKSKKHLTTLQLSPVAWSYREVEKYEINSVRSEVSIGSEIFKITSETRFLSEGTEIDINDINPADVLSFQGIDSQVLSVTVEKGHGYLRLENDENFVGGWIEIGQSLIHRIREDMLLLVPEGSYQVNISHKGGGGTKSIIVNRNEETVLNIGDLEIPEPQYGIVLFSMDPASAELYIDGTKTDISQPVRLTYGIHQLIARSEGYQSITQYIRVGQESAGINIALDPNRSEQEDESGQESSSDTVTDYYKIYVDAPEEVEVYLDGNYIGISPCSFRKTAGAHVITLRKTGYETRSYTIQVEEDEKDLSYSFANLDSNAGKVQ